LLLLYILIGF